MQYSRQDFRAVDMLAMILTGLGAFCFLLASWTWAQGAVAFLPGYFLGGITFTCSGLALNLKLKELEKNSLREPGEPRGSGSPYVEPQER